VTPLALVLYVAAALALLGVVPGAYVLVREALERRIERRAIALREAATTLLRHEEERHATATATAETLSARFDQVTIQRALEARLEGHHRDVELFERLGFTARYLRQVRMGGTFFERAHAANVLGRLGIPEACPPLILALDDPDEDVSVKRAAADALAQIRDTRAIPHLVRELHGLWEGASPHVADALVAFGREALGALTDLLGDEAEAARAWAARILGRIGDPAASSPLRARLGDTHAKVREAAAEALGRLEDARSGPLLANAALFDPSPRVRAAAAFALAHVDDDRAAETLVAALSDEDAAARARALAALAAMRFADVAPVRHALSDPVPSVRKRAALALDRMGVVESWVAELAAADDPARGIALRDDLALVAGAGLLDAVLSYAGHASARVRTAIADIGGELGAELGAKGTEAALVRLLADGDSDVRTAAVIALGKLGGPAAERILVGPGSIDAVAPATLAVARVLLATEASVARAVNDLQEDRALRHAVVKELDRAGQATWARVRASLGEVEPGVSRGAIATQIARLRTSDDEDARWGAIRAIEQAAGEDALDALVEALAGDPSARVRLAALRALAARPWSPVKAALARAAFARAARDPNVEVARAASRALVPSEPAIVVNPAGVEPMPEPTPTPTPTLEAPDTMRSRVDARHAGHGPASRPRLIGSDVGSARVARGC
jgi:HEAT repeat protein